MIDINELRKVLADCYWPTSPVAINELLDRLEAAEKERDVLKAKIERMERQEPVAWLIDWADEPDLGHYFSESAVDEDSGRSRPLFLHPVPASVPEGWQLVPRPPTPTMVKAGLESSHVLNVHRVLACYDAMIDAAPEAKP